MKKETPSLKEIKELVEEYNNCFPDLLEKINLKQKARKYKEIIENGCGKAGFHSKNWKNEVTPLICGKDGFLCPECQEKIKLISSLHDSLLDLIKENGIVFEIRKKEEDLK